METTIRTCAYLERQCCRKQRCVCTMRACKCGKTHLAFIILLTSSSLSSSHRLSLRVLYPSVSPLPLQSLTSATRFHIGLKKKRGKGQQLVYKRRHKTRRGRAGVLVLLAAPLPCRCGSECRSKTGAADAEWHRRGSIGRFRSVSRCD